MTKHHPTPKARSTGGSPAVLAVLLLASTLTVMAGAIIAPVLEVIRGDLGLSGTAAGFIITTHGLTIALASPLVGRLIDRVGVRTPLVAGLVLYGVAGASGAFIDSYAGLLLSRMAFGLAAAAVFAGTTVAMLALYRGAQRDRLMGWRSTAMSMGGIVWPLLGGVVGGLSWHAPFLIYAVGIPLGLAAWLILPRTDAAAASEAPAEAPAEATAGDAADSGRAEPADRAGSGSILGLLRRSPALLGHYALLVISSVLLYALAIFMPIRLGEVGVNEPFLVALVSMASTIAMSLIGLLYGRVRSHLGYAALLRTSAALWLGAFLILGFTDSAVVMAAAMGLFGLGLGILMPAVTVLISDSAPADQQGRAVALSGTASFAGQFASPLLLGPVVDATSTKTGYLGAAGLAAAVLLVLLLVRVTTPVEEHEENGRGEHEENGRGEHEENGPGEQGGQDPDGARSRSAAERS
ncbi:MFS transporter [Streptomyces sp. 549]|uniref:MFS transporter n=1 Tax=Streptomyces sp. 549 TaxID=3049076 RepID=UPI0024C2EDAC|nr:MFS transporter [Streptomyces sp. 549]MDK1472386.1 MFS transporter [Streptomyces sp. 549]